jgi:hypothetical protein
VNQAAKRDRDVGTGDEEPRKTTINYLVGPGVSHCSLELPHFEILGFDVSALLMKKRESLIKRQSTLEIIDEILYVSRKQALVGTLDGGCTYFLALFLLGR